MTSDNKESKAESVSECCQSKDEQLKDSQENQGKRDSEANAKNNDGPLDIGAEEFSEKIYDENAPTPREFDEPHHISSTGSDLTK